MAVPERVEMVQELLNLLEWERSFRDCVFVSLVMDEETPKAGPWLTAKRAWQAAHPGATHHLVVQDDALPCRNAIHGCVQAIQAVHESLDGQPAVVSFFCKVWERAREIHIEAADSVRYRSRTAKTGEPIEAAWMRLGVLAGGVANCLPTSIIPDFLQWGEAHVSPKVPHDDHRLSMFCTARQIPIYATVPSLFEHRDGPSIMQHCPGVNRRASWALESIEDARRYCWPRFRPDEVPFHQVKGPDAFASFVRR
jgi:hypothetical protein